MGEFLEREGVEKKAAREVYFLDFFLMHVNGDLML